MVDKWRLLGSIKVDAEFNLPANASIALQASQLTSKPVNQTTNFDLDTYKILLRYFNKPENFGRLRILKHYSDTVSLVQNLLQDI